MLGLILIWQEHTEKIQALLFFFTSLALLWLTAGQRDWNCHGVTVERSAEVVLTWPQRSSLRYTDPACREVLLQTQKWSPLLKTLNFKPGWDHNITFKHHQLPGIWLFHILLSFCSFNCIFSKPLPKWSPWYNCTGWLGVKHQLTYLLFQSVALI